jgi:hypothetical protein
MLKKKISMTVVTEPRGRFTEFMIYFLRLGRLGLRGHVDVFGRIKHELIANRRLRSKEQMRERISPNVWSLFPSGEYWVHLLHGFWCLRLLGLPSKQWLNEPWVPGPKLRSSSSTAPNVSRRHILKETTNACHSHPLIE